MATMFRWRGREFKTKFTAATSAGIRAGAVHYQNAARKLVSVSAVELLQGRNKLGRFTKKAKRYVPARHGDPPRRRTGFGSKNILHEHDAARVRSRVGVARNAIYMLYHELGSHPWMMPTLKKHRAQIVALILSYGRRWMR